MGNYLAGLQTRTPVLCGTRLIIYIPVELQESLLAVCHQFPLISIDIPISRANARFGSCNCAPISMASRADVPPCPLRSSANFWALPPALAELAGRGGGTCPGITGLFPSLTERARAPAPWPGDVAPGGAAVVAGLGPDVEMSGRRKYAGSMPDLCRCYAGECAWCFRSWCMPLPNNCLAVCHLLAWLSRHRPTW